IEFHQPDYWSIGPEPAEKSYTLPSGVVTFPASKAFAPSVREGWPPTLTSVPTGKVPFFQPARIIPLALPPPVILHVDFWPSASVTSITISGCGLTILTDLTVPWTSTFLSVYQKFPAE